MRRLVLSLFPGIDLLGMGFEQAGFTVVRGPDPLFGGDIAKFHMPACAVRGIIAGSPCQDFSRLRRVPPTGYGVEMLRQFVRVVTEAQPAWFLLENVPGVPAVEVPGFTVQRMHVRASEFGAKQHRLRVLQFGYRDGLPLILTRPVAQPKATAGAALATEGNSKARRSWPEFCALQGLTTALELPDFTIAARYRAVGNGVFVPMAREIAEAIEIRAVWAQMRRRPCACGCGRPLPLTKRVLATPACRKRAERRRKGDGPGSAPVAIVTHPSSCNA